MNIDEKILEILHDFETFKSTDDEQGVYAKTTSYMPFIDRIKALTIPVVVGTLPCDECVDGQKWSPYYAKYVECDCRK